MKFGRLTLCFLALASLGWLESASWADSHGKFPGKGSREAYNESCKVGNAAADLGNKGDLQGAIKLDKQAISLYPLDSMWHHNLACHLNELKKYDEGIKAEEHAISLEPSFEGAWLIQGECYEGLGKYDDALRCYRKAYSIKCDVDTCFSIGDVLRLKKQYLEAKPWYSKALRLTKDPVQISQINESIKKLQPLLEASH